MTDINSKSENGNSLELPTHLPAWQIIDSHPELVQPLLEALKEVYDPEIRLNVIDLGLVRDAQMGESEAQLTMILTTPFCPYGPLLMESVRQKAEAVLNKPTKVTLGTEYWTPMMMPEDLRPDWGIF